jgi:putative ABC transport system ATP-binding protein
MDKPIIEAKHLSKTYFTDEVETPVLFGLDFTIQKGEFVAIMGPSGSGKSTLLHILGFLDEETGGTYRFNGKRMKDLTEDEIAHIRNEEMGFVFQAFNLLARTTVYENVRLPLLYSSRPEKEWDERVTKAITAVGLEHRMDFEPSKLSGGEKQRVAIARALINDPKVIFADEPTGNLDSKSGQVVMEILQDLNRKHGHTIILITHETYTAEFAQRIIKIKDGRVDSDHHLKHQRDANHGFHK